MNMMNNISYPKLLVFLATTFLLFGCSEDDVVSPQTGTTVDPVTGTPTTDTLSIGSGIGSGFTAGNLQLSTNTIITNGTTTVTATIVDSFNSPSTASNTVTFDSFCHLKDPNTTLISPISVTTTSGIATMTYTDQGCMDGADTITAKLNGDPSLTADTTITITTVTPSTQLGTGTGTGFIASALDITSPSIPFAGTTAVSVNVVNELGALKTSSQTVTFSSTCEANSEASFDFPIVTTITGTATVNYTATTCSGTDIITASIGTTTAQGTVSIAAPPPPPPLPANSIQFDSASDSLIALKGAGSTTGLPELSTVNFTVLNADGVPVAGESVTFSLSSSAGGAALSTLTATSDVSGIVTTNVQSGYVTTSVNVSVSVDSNPTITTTSDAIAISTGPPHQDSMSLSATTLNPRAWNFDRKTVAITAQMSDRFSNPVRDGTIISFKTELGSIENSCTTTNGACSVNWTSGNPRGDAANAGRSTIIATAVGDESFVDINANGIFDGTDTFTDLDESYHDINESGSYDLGEWFDDLDGSGDWSTADGQYGGSGCATNCAAINSVNVRASMVLVMAEDTPAIHALGTNGSTNDLCSGLAACNTFLYSGSLPSVGTNVVSNVVVTFGGRDNAQTLPVGTSITMSTTNGEILGGGTNTVPNTTGLNIVTVLIGEDTSPSSDGFLSAAISIGDGGALFDIPVIGIDDTGTFVAPATVLLGTGSGIGFVEGDLEILPTTSLAYGGSTPVSVNIVDSLTNALITDPTTVTFSSTCATNSQASFSNATVFVNTGTASTTYTGSTCEGLDVITATIDGTTTTASSEITFAAAPPPVPASIQFESASPSLIALKGAGSTLGLPETSTVTFTVLNADGDPVASESVTFALGGTVGGATLSTLTATSDVNGIVTTNVQSGYVTTNVSVSVVVDSNPTISNTSAAIAISTGPPHQDSMSLSAATLNPRAWNFDGKTVAITAQMADRFSNPVRDGTIISFKTELGAIESSCTTTGGSCSVNWTSGNPRGTTANAGRSTIIATAVGDESFVDINANGIFDGTDTFTDLDESYLDVNENGSYDLGEWFDDLDGSLDWSAADGQYGGSGCATNCAAINSVKVRASMVLVMAEDTPAIHAMQTVGTTGIITDLCTSLATCDAYRSSPLPSVGTNTISSLMVTFGGRDNAQTLPAGTSIAMNTTNGEILSGATNTIPDNTGFNIVTVQIGADTTPSSDGFLSADISIGDGGGSFIIPVIGIDDTGTFVAPATVLLGTGSGLGFVEGELEILPTTSLAYGASTPVSVNIVDSLTNALITDPTTVTFSSNCATAGQAGFSNASILSITGTVTTTFTGSTCEGVDVITATIEGTTTTANKAITFAPAPPPVPASIQFDSASASLIALKGTGATTGLSENSTITFTVLDGSGAPIGNESVSFSVENSSISLSSSTAISGSDGKVTTIIQSGTVATTVFVTAVVDSNTTISATSNTIAIATGPADQNSMSLSASSFNPRAWNVDGQTVSITARLADRFNNPIQDGTSVLFTTELGAIEPTCTTIDGACSVNWISQDPRGTVGPLANAGRTTILAHIEGEESFVDINANGIFDNTDTFTDLGEAYLDENENGSYDSGEVFIDFNGNGGWDAADGQYNGSGCAINCSATNSVTVRDSLVVVMAENTPALLSMGINGSASDLCNDYASCQTYISSGASLNMATVGSVNAVFGGVTNEQTLPLGTAVNFKVTNGKITSGEKHTVPNTTSAAQSFNVTLAADATPSNDGVLTAEVTIGGGGGVFSFFIASINDSSTTAVLQLGRGSGAGFVANELEIKAPEVETGSNTDVSVFIVDANSNLSTLSNDVTFVSFCSLQGLATFSATNVNTTTGIATTTYIDNGCSVSDTIIATADWDTSLTASGDITIVPSPVTVRIGTGTGGGFVESDLLVTLPNIAADASTTVSVNLVDALAALITTPNTVIFSSTCEQAGTATFSSTSVTTSTGTATTTYTAAGCSGADTITATITVDTVDKVASGIVTVAAASAGSIQFTSVSHSLIALQGTGSTTGLPENSTVTFTVLDGNGIAVANELVNFSLNSTIGGITLSQNTSTSDGSGIVTTTIQSGTVATSVRVSAVVDSNPLLATTSDAIAIATGPADQNSMSLSASTFNPRAWDLNGVTVAITARLADRFNNPIQDGTSILFTTELGSIGATCTTVDGACSVDWLSQNPRGDAANAGRTTIIATVEGEESFIDFNANGVYDDGVDSFTDLAEAYLDENENGSYDLGEYFIDFDGSADWTNVDGSYNGSSCASNCSATNSVTVRESLVLVMSEDTPAIHALGTDGSTNNLCSDLASCNTYLYSGALPSIGTNFASSLLVTLGGITNAQTLPSATDITFDTTNGEILSGGAYSIGSTTTNNAFYILFDADTTPSDDGFLSATINIGDGGATFNMPIIGIDDTGTAVIPSTISLGTGVDLPNPPGTFVDGALDILSTNIAFGASTTISVNIVDSVTGILDTTANTVTFTSTCVTNGQASFDHPSIITITGTATVTYEALTCEGPDVIIATSGTATATGTITVAPATAGSIQFSSVSHSLIALQGTGSTSGLPESSTITFTVTDNSGFAVNNELVNFSLDSIVGGITLASFTDTTDGSGQVAATVLSGTVATSVRVSATVDSNPALVTTSSAIVIATGPPDQDSLSIYATELNPQGWDTDGTEVVITARMADRFNNRIQDGTAILFTTELGSITSSCTTLDGACTVSWFSQGDRGTTANAGRTTILATVEGEESFMDIDGDGVYSDGDIFTDLAEAYRDDNENDAYDLGESFIDFDSSGDWTDVSTMYNGAGCTNTTVGPPGGCDPVDSITVRSSLVLVMAEDVPTISAIGINGYNTDGIDATQCDADAPAGAPVSNDIPACICVDGCDGVDSLGVAAAGVGTTYPVEFDFTTTMETITFTIDGINNQQVLPITSSINFTANNGTILAGDTHTVTSTNSDPTLGTGITQYTVYVLPDGVPSSDPAGVWFTDITVGGVIYNTFAPILIVD